MINLLAIIFICNLSWSAVDLGLSVPSPHVKQGAVIDGIIRMSKSNEQTTNLQSLTGKVIGKTVYFHEMSPFIGREGKDFFEAEAKIIFLKVPETRSFTEVIGKEEVKLTIDDVIVDPIDEERTFIFGNFEIPRRKSLIFWFILFLVLGLIVGISFVINRKISRAKNKKAILERVKNELLSCKNYEDVVLIWRSKRDYIKIYPTLEESFKKLESVLFKHQFKPYRKDEEVKEVMDSYVKFASEVEGVLRGV